MRGKGGEKMDVRNSEKMGGTQQKGGRYAGVAAGTLVSFTWFCAWRLAAGFEVRHPGNAQPCGGRKRRSRGRAASQLVHVLPHSVGEELSYENLPRPILSHMFVGEAF